MITNMAFLRAVVNDIADEYIPYDAAVEFCRLAFANWTDEETYYRPVDIDELYECAIEWYERNR